VYIQSRAATCSSSFFAHTFYPGVPVNLSLMINEHLTQFTLTWDAVIGGNTSVSQYNVNCSTETGAISLSHNSTRWTDDLPTGSQPGAGLNCCVSLAANDEMESQIMCIDEVIPTGKVNKSALSFNTVTCRDSQLHCLLCSQCMHSAYVHDSCVLIKVSSRGEGACRGSFPLSPPQQQLQQQQQKT
jgi:hypothetical protein